MPTAADLWQFSLTTYARAGVANHCLYLQDQWAANINIILWLLWLEQRGTQVDATLIHKAETIIAAWHEALIKPLRQLRRQFTQQFAMDDELIGATYQQLKAAELQAEQVEQKLLAGVSDKTEISESALLPGKNLAIYLNGLGVLPATQQTLLDLLQAQCP